MVILLASFFFNKISGIPAKGHLLVSGYRRFQFASNCAVYKNYQLYHSPHLSTTHIYHLFLVFSSVLSIYLSNLRLTFQTSVHPRSSRRPGQRSPPGLRPRARLRSPCRHRSLTRRLTRSLRSMHRRRQA